MRVCQFFLTGEHNSSLERAIVSCGVGRWMYVEIFQAIVHIGIRFKSVIAEPPVHISIMNGLKSH